MSEFIFVLIFGFIMLGLGAFALITGKLLSRRGITRREEKPVLYWIGTIFYLVIGVGFLSWGAVTFIN